jgi:hypothetical protein
MDLRCTLRAAYTASLLDTAESRSMLPGSPAAASPIEPALPAYFTYLQSFALADAPDLQPASLHTSLGKTQSTISRVVNKVRGERFWPSPITAGSRSHSARCPPAAGAPSVPPKNRIQGMANRVAVCLLAGERASLPSPAEAIPSGSCVRRWDYVLLLSPGA